MNIVFLTISRIANVNEHGLYSDLICKLRDEGHNVYIVCSTERRYKLKTRIIVDDGIKIIQVRILNMQKTNFLEKGLSTITLSRLYSRAIDKYLADITFDLILYTTPPITFNSLVKSLKSRNTNAKSYLLLKDIFPQNAVDIGLFNKNSLIYKYFRRKEKSLYLVSDYIGCMSPANVKFLLHNNPFISKNTVEVAPNSIYIYNHDEMSDEKKNMIRNKYHLPTGCPVFVYGGNLGRPQGIEFLIKCLDANKSRKDCHFLIVGNGTEYHRLDEWKKVNPNACTTLMSRLPRDEYEHLIEACDVGLIFLDYRFTIPNYPSRLLAYLKKKKPVICATDPNTDIGRIAEENGYGFWCESLREVDFSMLVNRFVEHPEIIPVMGEKGYRYLCENYTVQNTYDAIMGHFS